MRPICLDLFCKEGGAGMGYYQAGFDVIGVDAQKQPKYPFTFIQGDALEVLGALVGRRPPFALIHASPPCQAYTTGGRVRERASCPRLIEPVRDLLRKVGVPYVIENVEGAPLINPVRLCGSMFGLGVRRHRLFECSFPIAHPRCTTAMHRAQGPVVGVYGHLHGEKGAWKGMAPSTLKSWKQAMGIDWMSRDGLSQAIPPAYTRWIGEQFLALDPRERNPLRRRRR